MRSLMNVIMTLLVTGCTLSPTEHPCDSADGDGCSSFELIDAQVLNGDRGLDRDMDGSVSDVSVTVTDLGYLDLDISDLDISDSGQAMTPRDEKCVEVQRILDQRCSGCHGIFAVAALDTRQITTLVEHRSDHIEDLLVVAGDAESSYLIQKIRGTHLAAGGRGVRMPPGLLLPETEVDTLIDWIDEGASCEGELPEVDKPIPDPNTLAQSELFQCDGQPPSSTARLRRIDRLQLRRRVGLPQSNPLEANPFDAPGASRYSTYSDRAQVDPVTLDLYLDMLPYVGTPWQGRATYNRLAREARNNDRSCMYRVEIPDRECIEGFVRAYLKSGVGVLDVTPAEVERLTDFAVDVLEIEGYSEEARAESLTTITSAAWLHTSALFDGELGSDEPDADGRFRLSLSEQATMIGTMLSSRGVGTTSIFRYDNDLDSEDRWTDGGALHLEALVRAVEDGTLADPAVAKALVREYAMGIDPMRADEWIDYGTHSLFQREKRSEEWMSDRLDGFFLEWFDVVSFASGFQDHPNATTVWGDDRDIRFQRAFDELRVYEGWNEPTGLMVFTDTIAKVVTDDMDVLRRLLTTNDWYLPATSEDDEYTHKIFGFETPIIASREGRWNTMPMDTRMGLLTHPVWLAAHGDAFEDGPSLIHRGKWVREHLFCQTVPPLELVNVQAMLPANDNDASARTRIESTIETQAECMGCHQFMNDLGKPFEFYNHAGGVRISDHGAEPNGNTVLTNAPDPALNREYTDLMDYLSALAGSEHVKRCFIRHTFRYFVGRDETLNDACVLSDMEASYDNSGGSFTSMLGVLATHEGIIYRNRMEVE
jgi:hypothetical protein